MYKKDDGQISISEFISPFGELDPENRWVNIAKLIDWEKYEKRYANRFSEDNGAPAIKFRMAMGTLIIKQRTGHSDEEVLQDIVENPYMQFLIGLYEFTTTPPFAQSSITNFRKYITAEMINEVNEDMFRAESRKKGSGDSNGCGSEGPEEQTKAPDLLETESVSAENDGEILLDATCAPANIKYPTDINLLNEAREKLEGMIDVLHPKGYATEKPRTYRKKARQAFLHFAKAKKHKKGEIRKSTGQQLRYVRRDLKHVEAMIAKFWGKQSQQLSEAMVQDHPATVHTAAKHVSSKNTYC